MAQATLFNPTTGARQAVESGSQEAQNLFGQGFVLEGSFNEATGVSTPAGQVPASTAGLAETVESIPSELPVAEGQEATIPGQQVQPSLGEQIATSAGTEIERTIGAKLQGDLESVRTDIKNLQTTVSESESLLEGELKDDFSRTELRKKLREEANIKSIENSLNDILNQMNDKQLSYQRGKQALVGESSTMKLLRGKEALLKEQFNAEMSWLTGKASIVQGNLDRADNIIKTYFDDAVAQRTDRIANLEMLFNLNNQKLIKLTEDEKQIARDQMALLDGMNVRQENEKDAIRTLMLDDVVASIWDKAGVNMTMPLDEILTKIQPFVAAEQGRRFNAIHGDSTVNVDSGQFGQADFENAGVIAKNETTGEWEVNISALDNFFTIRGIKDKDKNAIVNAANLAADNLNAGTQQNTGDIVNQSIGAFGFPKGTTAGEAIGLQIKEIPSTIHGITSQRFKELGQIGDFFGDIGSTLFGEDK